MADGTPQRPGGWNRFAIEVEDLQATVARLRAEGVDFRSDIITGIGGKQALAQDPSGNLIELFQPIIPQAHEDAAFRS
jgi:catechol 2,3-dioxygenase-like lactoylglutathione lyase family enzyme